MGLFGKVLKKEGEEVDLTPYVAQARRGLRRDVKALADVLSKGKFFVPLAKQLEAIPPAVGNVLTKPYPIHVHTLTHPETKTLAYPLFTKLEFLAPLETDFGWKTDGGVLRYSAVPPKTVFDLILPDLESGKLECALINPFHPTMLQLEYQEVRVLANNQPIPLVHYLKELPVQAGEKFIAGAPAVKPSRELVDTIRAFVSSHQGLNGYDLFQMFNAERDIEPHLALNLYSKQGENEPEIAREMILAIQERIPAMKYIDILFNSSISSGVRDIETFRKTSGK
jgi:hypothetical protein